MEELNKFRQFLTEGKKKTIKETSFGNDPESRYEYIRPLMSKLPDSARTEALIDGMEEALAEDDKMEFDFYFVEAMKMLGLEDKLMEPDDMMSEPDYEDYAPDSALGPNPSFVEENDKVLDGIIKEGTWSLGGPKDIDSIIKGLQGLIKMADDAQNKKNAAGRGFVDGLKNQLKSEGWVSRLYKTMGDDTFFDYYDTAKAAAEVRDFDNVKNHLGDAIARAEELKATIMKNSGIKEGEEIKEGKFKAGDMVRLKNDGGTGPEFAVIDTRKMFGKNLEVVRVTDENGKTTEYDETQLVLSWSPEQKANVFVRENKALKASNDLEKTLNSVVDELTDDQIDSITNMILDLRDKVKAKKK